MKIKSENYLNIQGFMRTELGLTGNDLLVYAIIYGCSQDGDSKFTGSLQYLADWCGATKHGIMKNLNNLTEKGLIIKEDSVVNGIKFVTYHVTELHTMQLSYTNNISSNISNIDTRDNTSNTNQQSLFTDNNKEVLEVRKKNADKVDWFISKYNEICKSLPKCQRVTTGRGKQILKILDKFSEEDVLTVFQNIEESDFCRGKNDRGWKANIDFILREDKFVSALEGRYNNKHRCKAEEISDGPTYRVSAEEKEEMRKAVERGDIKEY